MKHVEKALRKIGKTDFIKITNLEDTKGIPPIVSFTIQSDPIKEVGVNGCQALDMLIYVKYLFESLNETLHSPYNDTTIAHIEDAIQAQHLRTKNRIKRNVEGTNNL